MTSAARADKSRSRAQRGSYRLGLLGFVAAAALLLACAIGWRSPLAGPQARPADKASPEQSRLVYRPIEQIRVGDRVVADDPDADVPETTRVDRATWRRLTLRARHDWVDGTPDEIHVQTLQPPEWVRAQGAQVGSNVPIPLDLHEFGLLATLRATVVANEPCPQLAEGPGRIVLTTINRLSFHLYDLEVGRSNGTTDTIRATGRHRFYRPAQRDWVALQDLSIGDPLQLALGRGRVAAKRRVPGIHRVFNLSVEGEHVYSVGLSGVLVHNSGYDRPYRGGRHGDVKNPTRDGLDSHHMPSKQASPLDIDDGPAIQMDPADHRRTASYGGRRGSPQQRYRDMQKALIDDGRFDDAFLMDVEDIQNKFGSKYDDAILEAIDALPK